MWKRTNRTEHKNEASSQSPAQEELVPTSHLDGAADVHVDASKNDSVWRDVFTVERMVLLFWIVFFAVWSMHDITDPDTPWHIATGRYILSHHYIPTTDPFSWSMRGKPWVTQEWLFEVLLAFGINHFQFAGAWGLLVLAHTVTVLVLYRLAVRITNGNRVIAAVAAVVGTLPAIIFWIIRPQIASYLMFAVFLWILQMVREGKFRVLWLVPPLMLLWANLHGSSVIGILVLLLEVAISFVPSVGRFARLELPKGARWRLLAAAIAGAAIGLLNPNHLGAYTYASLSTNPLMTNNILEWHSPNFHNGYFKYGVLSFLIIVFLLLLARKKSIPMRETLYFGGSFAVMLIYQRFFPYVAIASVPLLAKVLSDFGLVLLRPSKFMRSVNAVVMAGTLVYFGVNLPTIKGPLHNHLSPSAYPIAAVNYMEKNHLLSGKLLNAYGFGGYLIYRGIPTFIDGRTDIFLHGSVFSDYLNMQNFAWNAPDLLNSYGFTVVLVPSNYALTTYLDNNSNWHVAYQDNTAVVFVRNSKS